MRVEYYKWPAPAEAGAQALDIPTVDPTGDRNAATYVPHPELTDAVNIALVLGLPLLVTGEPGTGKSQLAYSIAHQLGFLGPFKFVAKSTSQARDLFYNYDALGRFYAAEVARFETTDANERQRAREPLNFIDYAALGRAILLAQSKAEVREFLPPSERADDASPGSRLGHLNTPRRSVVLIDEIDKAPRDFTNDLLDEIESMRFRVAELREEPTPELTSRNLWPVIVITSNSERPLPDAFLRRCVYFHLPFPERRKVGTSGTASYAMDEIVAQRLGRDFSSAPMVSQALDLFYRLREMQPRLRKRPSTAELLNWLVAMRITGADHRAPLKAQSEFARTASSALLKNPEDLPRGLEEIKAWAASR